MMKTNRAFKLIFILILFLVQKIPGLTTKITIKDKHKNTF